MSASNSTSLQLLIAHLVIHPCLPQQLRLLHSLALYDSGEALLGTEEKEALQASQELAGLLEAVPEADLKALL